MSTKYNRTSHLPWSPGTTNDDRISNSVESLLGKEIVITEKLDGSNTGMVNDGVYARSHAVFTENPWDREIRQLHSMKIKGHLGSTDDELYIFGENLEAIHSIEYTNLKSYFYMFGVREKSTWASWSEVEDYAFLLDLPTVPVLFKGIVNTQNELRNIVDNLVKEPSELGGEREGVVVRIANSFDDSDFSESVMKWVRKDHVTTDVHWTRNWEKAKIK